MTPTPDFIVLIAGTAWLFPLLRCAFAHQEEDDVRYDPQPGDDEPLIDGPDYAAAVDRSKCGGDVVILDEYY